MMIDIKAIQKDFNRVISYSQWVEDVHSDSIFENWKKNKAHFIDKWGGLTYELDEVVTLDMPEKDKNLMFKEFFTDLKVYSDKRELVKEFFCQQKVEDFFQNKVSENFTQDDVKINKGAKLSKSLKFFIDDKVILDRFQINLSRMIQNCKITGKMVMSVHPLDFLSSSENVHNWHSCHALDGEYRAGNLSYMQDEHTFMFYLKADKNCYLPNFPEEIPWNSKKWRVLMYMGKNEDIFVSGRQYPFSNQIALEIVTNKFLAKFYDLSNLQDWKLISDKIDYTMVDDIGSLQFNDCLGSPTYRPLAMLTKDVEEEIDCKTFDRLVIGHAVACLECGGNNISLSDGFKCDECGGYTYCEHCGEPCYEEEMYWLEGELVCEDCWDSNGLYCEGCQETFNEFKTDMYWDEDTGCYYCQSCYDNLLDEREKSKGEMPDEK